MGYMYSVKLDHGNEENFMLYSGADVILDFVGASYWENHTKCVSVDGRIVLLGLVRATVHMHCMLFLPLF